MNEEPVFRKIWEGQPGARFLHLGVEPGPAIRHHWGNAWNLVGWIDGSRVMSFKSISSSRSKSPYEFIPSEEHEIIKCATPEEAIKFAKEYFNIKAII